MTIAEGYFHSLWLKDEASTDAGRAVDDLYMWLWWFCVIWFVFLMGLTAYFVVKYRRRPGVAAPRSSAHNTPLEIAWTIIPSLFLIYMFFAGFQGYIRALVTEGGAEEIYVEAAKWDWTFTYPNGTQTAEFTFIDENTVNEDPIFVVPEDHPIELRMTSTDVIHAFWVPDFRTKFDVFPNRYTSYTFRADKLDNNDPVDTQGRRYRDHIIFCAEYCGTDHSEMVAVLRVMSKADYKDWVLTGGLDIDEFVRENGEAAAGEITAKMKGCVTCHSIDGSAKTGPTWANTDGTTGFGYEIPLEDGSTVVMDDNYIRESILDPSAKIHKGYPNQMVSYAGRVNDDELRYLIAYMKSLSDRGPKSLIDEDTDQDAAEETEPTPGP